MMLVAVVDHNILVLFHAFPPTTCKDIMKIGIFFILSLAMYFAFNSAIFLLFVFIYLDVIPIIFSQLGR